MSLLVVFVVNVDHSEPAAVPIRPLEVVHDGPSEVAPHIHPIFLNGQLHVLDVVPVELQPELVLQGILQFHLVLSWDTDPILEDVDWLVVIPLVDPVEQVPQACGIHVQPVRVSIRPNQVPIDILLTKPQPPITLVVSSHLSGVVHVLGGVVVQPQEVERTFHQGRLFLSEGW